MPSINDYSGVNLDAFSFDQLDSSDNTELNSSDNIDWTTRDRHDTVVGGLQPIPPLYSNNQISNQQIGCQEQLYYDPALQQEQSQALGYSVDARQDHLVLDGFGFGFRGSDYGDNVGTYANQLLGMVDEAHTQPFPAAGWQPMNAPPPPPPQPQAQRTDGQSPGGNHFTLQQQPALFLGTDRVHSTGSSNGGSISPRSRKVPIAHQRSYSGAPSPTTLASDQPTMVRATGPMSRSVDIPKRPKPGRKPIPQEDAADRRRMQNRMAQRCFRDKRQQKLADALREGEERKLQYEADTNQFRRDLQKLKQDHANEVQALHAQMKTLLVRVETAEQRAEAESQRADNLDKQLQAMTKRRNLSLESPVSMPSQSFQVYAQRDVPTPPEENGNEIDFTNYGRSNDSTHMDFIMTEQNSCGFCTDAENCTCKQAAANTISEPTDQRSASKQSASKQSASKQSASKQSASKLPGSCDMCQADPARAQACRDLAEVTTMAPKPKVTMGPPKYSCSQMIEEFNKFGQRTATISSLFGGALHTYPNTSGPGYTLDDQEASQVLINLSRRSTGLPNERRSSQASQASTIH